MTEHLPFNTSQLRLKLRVEDFLLLDESGAFTDYNKTELIDGEIFFKNAQHRPHMVAKNELAFRIRLVLDEMGSDLFVGTEGCVRLSVHDLPEPDILLTNDPYGAGPVPGESVKLVIEVADTTLDFDMTRKAVLYANAGVPEYWIADVNVRVIRQMWNAHEGGYAETRLVTFGVPINAATIIGLTVPTATL